MKSRNKNRRKLWKLGGLATAMAAHTLGAQTAATNAPPSGLQGTNDLSRVVVEGLPLNETVLPTARPVDSVMGDDRSIIDTPR